MKLLTGIPERKLLTEGAVWLEMSKCNPTPKPPIERTRDSITALVDSLFTVMREIRATKGEGRGPLLAEALRLCRALNRCGYKVVMQAHGRLCGASRRQTAEGSEVQTVGPIPIIPVIHPTGCDCSECVFNLRARLRKVKQETAYELLMTRLNELERMKDE